MSNIKTSQSVTIADPKVRAVVQRVSNTFRLTVEKVVASQSDPAAYPLPADTKSVERLLLKRFRHLPADRRKSAMSKVMKTVTAPASSRSTMYGDLAAVNLRSATSVRDQVRQLKFPVKLSLSAAEVPASGFAEASPLVAHTVASAAVGTHMAASAAVVTHTAEESTPVVTHTAGASTPVVTHTASAPTPKRLELRVKEVKCSDDTNELSKDEISLGGTMIDASGKTSKISALDVGDFKTGDVRKYSSPKTIGSFDLSKGTSFPRTYYALLALAEIDMGGFAGFLDELVDSVEDEVSAALAAGIGGVIGATGGPVGAIIGAVVGLVVASVIGWLKSLWDDDIFKVVPISATMDSATDRWSGKTYSPDYVAKFSDFKGSYSVTYAWNLV